MTEGFPDGSVGKESAYKPGDLGDMGWEDLVKKNVATHSSILLWKIPRTEKPGRLPWGHKELDMIEVSKYA